MLAGLSKQWCDIVNPDRTTTRQEMWFVGSIAGQQLMQLDGKPFGERIRFMDGPYDDDYIHDIVIGKVIGVLQPSGNRDQIQ